MFYNSDLSAFEPGTWSSFVCKFSPPGRGVSGGGVTVLDFGPETSLPPLLSVLDGVTT